MSKLIGSVDASSVANWLLMHSASAAGKAGAAFVGSLIAVALVGMLVFGVNLVAFFSMCRRCHWPQGHKKWTWLLAIPVSLTLALAVPGFYVWLGLVVPVAYWVWVGRLKPAVQLQEIEKK